MTTAATRIDKARWWALTDQPFYGALAMSLTDVIDPGTDTAATDGRNIRWNPEFVDTLTDEQLRFVLLHETLHCAHQHLWRLPTDDRGNVAGDHEINLTLAEIPGILMPTGGLCDPQYRGMACEEILGRLPDPQPQDDGQPDPQDGGGQSGTGQQGQGQQDGQGDRPADPCGSFTAPADTTGPDSDTAALRDRWEGNVIQAVQSAQASGVGHIPGDMARVLERIRHQGVDWRREMSDFVRDTVSMRNDWSRSSRRHAWQSVIYPRRRADDIGTVIFARDTSGSITDSVCAQYSALITDCVSELGCTGLVVDCDAHIQAEYVIDGFESCPLTAQGGGGTDFRPVFDRAAELIAEGQSVAGVVYLTDLCGPMPDECDIPTLWLSTTSRVAKFGRTVPIET